MPNEITIFDFDQTLTKIHTFQTKCIEKFGVTTPAALIHQGAEDARTNLKDGLTPSHISLEGDRLFCLATYHNNPDYVAGYIQTLLGKTITPSMEPLQFAHDGDIAIKTYRIEGVEKPLFISYIPKQGAEFNAARGKLTGKNEQIAFLSQILQVNHLMEPGASINYYDDDSKNIDKVKPLANIKAHLVDGHAESFQFTTLTDKTPASLTQAGAGSAVIPDVPARPNVAVPPVLSDRKGTEALKVTGQADTIPEPLSSAGAGSAVIPAAPARPQVAAPVDLSDSKDKLAVCEILNKKYWHKVPDTRLGVGGGVLDSAVLEALGLGRLINKDSHHNNGDVWQERDTKFGIDLDSNKIVVLSTLNFRTRHSSDEIHSLGGMPTTSHDVDLSVIQTLLAQATDADNRASFIVSAKTTSPTSRGPSAGSSDVPRLLDPAARPRDVGGRGLAVTMNEADNRSVSVDEPKTKTPGEKELEQYIQQLRDSLHFVEGPLTELLIELRTISFHAAHEKNDDTTLGQEQIVFSKQLDQLITEVIHALNESEVGDTRVNRQIKLTKAVDATVAFLHGKMSINDYQDIAREQRTGSNTVMQRIGALMLALASIFKSLGCLSISRRLATMGVFAQKGVGKPMLELAEHKGSDNQPKAVGDESLVDLPPDKTVKKM